MKKIKRTNRHHRRSRSTTGGIKYDGKIHGINNVIRVDYKKHQHFHGLFQDTHPDAIAEELNKWIDPEWVIIAIPRVIL
jgi:hypothetical protein